MPAESFTKLFSSITTSTIWCEPDHVRIAWITMLALADRDGYVGASVPGLAAVAHIEVDQAREAIKCFLSPDPDSRTKEHEGRRIEEAERGWKLLNYTEFRKRLDAEEAKERKRRWWIENRGAGSRPETSSLDKLDQTRHITETDTDTDKKQDQKTAPKGVDLLDGIDVQVAKDFKALRSKLRAPITKTAMAGIQREADKAGVTLEDALILCCERGWRGFKSEWLTEKTNGANHAQPKETLAARLTRKAIAERIALGDDGTIGQDDGGPVDQDVGLLLGKVGQSMR